MYQDLIDWPNALDSLNDDEAFPEGASCCRDGFEDSNVSTPVNSHTAHAHRRLADMARWLGRPEAEAARYDALADGIVAGLKKHAMITGAPAKCDPPAPACFLDGFGHGVASHGSKHPTNHTGPITHTSVQASMYTAGCGLLTPAEALQLVLIP